MSGRESGPEGSGSGPDGSGPWSGPRTGPRTGRRLSVRPRSRSRSSRRPSPAPGRAGRVPVWVPLLGLLALGALLVPRLAGDVDLAGFTRIDPSRTRIEDLSGFVDPRWRPALSARLAALPQVSALDPAGVEGIRGALLSLPFVAEVGESRVIWPDGCEVAVRLREPAACIAAGDGFLAVSKEGVVLPGEWTRPPWIQGGWLPALAPLAESPGAPHPALPLALSGEQRLGHRPGALLSGREHCDALAVAVSMRAALSAEDFETMGAPLIDASHARMSSIEDPGVVLRLPEGRVVYFGRPPDSGQPGELPPERKWAALARALKALRPTSADARDWSLLDVRWDVPDVLWRDAEPARADAAPPE